MSLVSSLPSMFARASLLRLLVIEGRFDLRSCRE